MNNNSVIITLVKGSKVVEKFFGIVSEQLADLRSYSSLNRVGKVVIIFVFSNVDNAGDLGRSSTLFILLKRVSKVSKVRVKDLALATRTRSIYYYLVSLFLYYAVELGSRYFLLLYY